MRLSPDPADWILAESLPSSNDYLMRGDFPAGTVVLTQSQTAGKGSHGRSWSATPGAFLFSGLLCRGEMPLPSQLLPIRMGLALAQALEKKHGVFLFLKWPNDLMLPCGRTFLKVGGVLIESSNHPEWRIVVGLGLNWTTAPPTPGAASLGLDPDFRLPFLPDLIKSMNEWTGYENKTILSAFEERSVFQTHGARYGQKVYPSARLGEDGQLWLYPQSGAALCIGDVRERLEIVEREGS
ncbi:MAG: hypothetical protein HS115_07225 [Spirochaetales bacterium]|nr:hypothetical protein [Spirochaetales bacterium]